MDFGHIRVPPNLNVPPSLRMLGVEPQTKLNCEILDRQSGFEVRFDGFFLKKKNILFFK